MNSIVDPEPEQAETRIQVGQDRAGHWLVQESHGLLEGRFISREAAWHFARAERHGFPGSIVIEAAQPLVPLVSFDPVRPDEVAQHRAL